MAERYELGPQRSQGLVDILDRILDDTHELWSDGLSRPNYAKAWAAQLKTPWGQSHLDRVALVDGPCDERGEVRRAPLRPPRIRERSLVRMAFTKPPSAGPACFGSARPASSLMPWKR